MLKFDESSTKALLTKALVQSEASEEIKEKVQVYIHDIFILSPEEFLHNAYLQSLQTCENLLVPDKMYTVTINSIRCEELGLDSTLQHLGEDAGYQNNMILLITGEYIAIEHITSIALEDADANDALLNSLTEAGLDKVKKLSDSIDIHENTPHDDLDRAVVEAQECKEFEKELGTRMFDLNAANKWSITSLALRKVIFGISLVDRKSASQMLTYGYNKNILLTLEVYDGYICICREANGSSLFCYVLKDPKSDVVKNEIESVVDSEDILQIPTGYINKHKSEEE